MGWAGVQELELVALQEGIAQQQAGTHTAAQVCQRFAEKVWECLEEKELAYVRTLQTQDRDLDAFLKSAAEQSAVFEASTKQRISSAEAAAEEVLFSQLA